VATAGVETGAEDIALSVRVVKLLVAAQPRFLEKA
jgi:hypothetical protein